MKWVDSEYAWMEWLEAHTINAWNDIADKFNQWDQLDSEEKLYLMEQLAWDGELS